MENLLENEMTTKFFNFYGLSLADINSETTNKRLVPRNKKGGKSKNWYQLIVNPTSTEGILAKTAVQVFDPTGISSYPDVYEAGKNLYNNPT